MCQVKKISATPIVIQKNKIILALVNYICIYTNYGN